MWILYAYSLIRASQLSNVPLAYADAVHGANLLFAAGQRVWLSASLYYSCDLYTVRALAQVD